MESRLTVKYRLISLLVILAALSQASQANAQQAIGSACPTVGWTTIQPNQLVYCNTSNVWALGEEITSTGYVGIGTALPTSPLEVFNNSTSGYGPGPLLLEGGGTEVGMTLYNTSAPSQYAMFVTGSGSGLGSGKLIIANAIADSIALAVDSNGHVGIGSASPGSSLDLSQKTDGLALPSGTTAQRPGTPINGMIRYNTTSTPTLEAYISGAWSTILAGSGSFSSIALGTSSAVTNPQRSGDATTGFYSSALKTVAIAANGIQVEQWNTIATGVDYLSITAGKSGTPPKIAVAGTTTTQSLNLVPAGTKGTLQFNSNTMYWEDFTNFNTAVGPTALPTLVSQTGGGNNGAYNVAVGTDALNSNTTGQSNTGVGEETLKTNTTGIENTAIGASALYSNTRGNDNVGIGLAADYSNLTGSENVGIGERALNSDTTGSYNLALGAQALYVSTASNNTAIGAYTLHAVTTGASNTALGYNVGTGTLTTGSNNILIGTSSAVTTLAAGTNGNLNIGNLLQGDMTYSSALGTEALYLQSTSGSVDYLQIAGGAAGSPGVVAVTGQGADTNVSISVAAKGTGSTNFTVGNVGIGTASPQAPLHVQGEAIVASTGLTCASTTAGALRYTSSQLQFCNGTAWQTINSEGSGGTTPGCGSSGTLSTQTQTTINVAAGCNVTFKVWGGAGGGTTTSGSVSGGGGGYSTITIAAGSAAVTYYLSVGGGGEANQNGYAGGAGATGYTGGSSGPTYGGGGGAATGVWTGGYGTSGTPVVIAGGGGGASYGNGGLPTTPGCTGGTAATSTAGGSQTGNYVGGGGGGGYLKGGAAASGGETYNGYGGSCYSATGGSSSGGSGASPGGVGDPNYPTGAGTGSTGNGTPGAIYYSLF